MKNFTVLLVIFIFNLNFSQTNNSQEYNFINEVVKYSKQDTIHLMDKFIIDFKVETKSFTEDNFREWWSPLTQSDTPNIDTFFENFNLSHMRSDFLANKNDNLINFDNLTKKFIPTSESDLINIRKGLQDKTKPKFGYKKYLDKVYLQISKPVFNCSKNWAIIISESCNPYLNTASGGDLNIYKKINDKWVLYHKLELWIN